MEIILWCFSVFIAFVVGAIAGKSAVLNAFVQTLEASEVKISLSKHGEQIYAHDEMTKAFLCQGSNMDEISEKLQKLDPTKTFIASNADVNKIMETDNPVRLS